MKACTVLFVAIACLLATNAMAGLAEEYAGYMKSYPDICQTAKDKPMAGGWKFISPKEIKENKYIQADAKKQAAKVKGCDKPDKKSSLHKVPIACAQVVNGVNYQYGAIAFIYCHGEVHMETFTHNITVKATGRK